jgi:hypothetical protein
MLWCYARGLDNLRIETSFDAATNEYVLTSTRGPHRESERFHDAEAFRVRLEALEGEIAGNDWTQVGGPIFLRDGWKTG